MGHKYSEILFTPNVQRMQSELHSRSVYAALQDGEDYNYLLSESEAEFIQARDSFYLASISESGWPYVQHRGGPVGFLRVIDEKNIGFVDFSGNRQYISAGNFHSNNRVALFLMDYTKQRRLKLLGRITQVADDDWLTLSKLEVENYKARIERAYVINIEGFDWNCPQHITPRFTEAQISEMLAPLIAEHTRLKKSIVSLPYPQVLGRGALPLIISGIRQLTPQIRAYELRHVQGLALPVIEAGAHLAIPVQLNSGAQVLRHYSICSNPARRDIYEIAVLNNLHADGATQAIHGHFQLGMQLHCSAPENYFQLHRDARPSVLIAAGIGITPIKSIAQHLKARGANFSLHYAGRSLHDMAFYDRLQREFAGQITFYPADQQRLNITALLQGAAPDSVFYACGPQTLLDELRRTAHDFGIDPACIRSEQFSPEQVKNAQALKLNLVKSGRQLMVEGNESILDALLNAGINLPHNCKSGNCKTCVVKVIAGHVQHQDYCLSDAEKNNQLMCPCVSRSVTSDLSLDI